jgi:ribonuclease HI
LARFNTWVSESANFCVKAGVERGHKLQEKWHPPTDETIKFNIDGAFSEERKSGGWGFVARDQLGVVRGAGAGKIVHLASAASAEAQACAQALQAAADWGMLNITIESDAQNLIRALESTDFDLAPEGVIYRDIKIFINLNFQSVKLNFRPRSCNKVAHAIAAMGAREENQCRL